MQNSQTTIFFEKLQSFIDNKELIKLTLASKKDKSSDLKKLIITPVELKKGYFLNFVYRHSTKDITKNFEIIEGLDLLVKSLENDFLNADLFAVNQNINLSTLPNGKVQLRVNKPTMLSTLTFSHDKPKERLIETINNVYLRELSITNVNGEVRREMSDKYKQINQYIELLAPNLNYFSTTNELHIADMGSGKGYLTFALHDYISNKLKINVKTTGVEFRQELVDTCNAIAQKAELKNISFVKGTIEKAELEKIDILIALHACDTATDEAIYRGIKSEALLIVCAPCCHKQIRKAMNVSNELNNITKFGILKERQAEIITDTLRAMILELNGYKTNVFEFISLEHTPKNVMIVGQKRTQNKHDKVKIMNDISAIKEMYGIKKHFLENLLNI